MLDAVVVGAGAAGVAAARRLTAAGLAVKVLEARGRVGGRAWTARLDGHPADLGCARPPGGPANPWTGIAQAMGLGIDHRPPDWGRGFAKERQLDTASSAARDAAYAALWALLEHEDGRDRSLAEALPAGNPWLPAIAATMGFISGAEPEALSLIDLQRYEWGETDWRVVEGYGRLIERHAESLDIALATPVERIDWGGDPVRMVTPKGTLDCRAVVVTAPTPVLLDGSLRFEPALPETKLEAAAGLPLGQAAKLYLGIDGRPFDIKSDRQVVGSPCLLRTAAYHIQPLGRPLVEACWGGSLAAELECAGPAAMADFALDELAALFGSSVRTRLRPLIATNWSGDPYARGGYSYARPGAADGRAVLAEPLAGRLFFAGEACSTHAYSTAHGAYQTGITAAEALVAEK